MHARLLRYAWSAVVALSFVVVGRTAHAQNLRVIPVPWVATDPTVPHMAYNGHATTFKAIARGGNGSYLYEWDYQGDGVYDYSAVTTNRYNLSVRFTYPNQAVTTTFNATVRVTSNGQTVTATYPVRIFADVPVNPAAATTRQLQVMRSVAVDDGLWYLHNRMARTGNEEDPLTGAQITGNLGESSTATAAGYLWTLGLNGHFVAYPSAYIGALPDPADNTARWTQDPYAEDATRIVNYLLTQVTVTAVTAADESNLTGFYPEVSQTPIWGTDDGLGLYIGSSPGDQTIYYMGHSVAALSVSHLAGFVAQVGDSNRVLGRRMEYVLQQLVDGLVWAQNEAGVLGSWYYTPNSSFDDLSTSLWGVTGLWHADEFAKDQGVIVPNLVKAHLLQYVQSNMNACPQGGTGGSYTTSYNGGCDFTTSACHTLALGWVGANTYDAADGRLAFPSYNGITRGNLRAWYDSSRTFIDNTFLSTSAGQNNWNTGFVVGGNFSRVDGQGNHYGMLHWQDAARAVSPPIVNFGTNDWEHLFANYFIGNQATDGGWNWVFSSLGTNSDSTGGLGLRAAWAILVLSPDAIPPLAIGQASSASAPEGTTIAFDGSQSDPGTGNPVYTWDFQDGTPVVTAQSTNHAFPDNGSFNVTLTSTSIGGVSTDTVPVTITNVAPTAAAGPDRTLDEGTALPFDVTVTDPGTADTFTYLWTFGDTTTSTTKNPSHTYRDNGTYTAQIAVTDDDGGRGTDALVVTVNNVAPTITSTPGNTALEAQQYTYTLAFTDPGALDTHTCSLPVAPAGMLRTGCTFRWTPNFAQAIGAAAPVTACVTDDDGGQACQSWTISVTFFDSDSDGLPDSWEIANFGNTAAQDQFGDPDGDGMNNLQEFTSVTDPLSYDGPGAPTTVSPICASVINASQTTLTVTNAVDPQGTPLTYDFQVYADLGLTIPVASKSDVPQGVGTTAWLVPVSLVENATYYWRVRAADPFTFGAYTAVCSFSVDTVNEPPGVPRINTPAFGAQANSLTPDLTVDNAIDPDPQHTLTYTFEVYRDPALSTLIARDATVPEGVATTTWTVSSALAEDTFYYWRVRATDDGGLSGDWSTTGKFFVTTVNAPPEPPILASPQNGTIVTSLRPDLVIFNADDADYDPLTYDWQLATDSTFTTVVASGVDVPPQGATNTTFTLAANLAEDTRYCWRVRSDDGTAQSAYTTACFLVSATNNAPSVPTLQNPSDNGTSDTASPSFSWNRSTDPEGMPVTYDVEVRDSTGTVVATALGVGGLVTTVNATLIDGATYTWRARAVDDQGLASAYSTANTFTVARHERPSAPRISAPAYGAQVHSFTPDLTVVDAVDLDPARTLTYTFEVYTDEALSTLIANVSGVAEGAATTTWTETTVLAEDTSYYWRARATDDRGVAGDWSTTGKFFVTTTNTPPSPPVLVSPLGGTVAASLRPPLVIYNADDADHDALFYDWQLATDSTFATLVAAGAHVAPQGALSTSFTLPADLVEDTRYCWRARSDDGAAQSAYAVACFLVSVTNDAPTVPALLSPPDGSTVDTASPAFTWSRSTDPEGLPVTYDVEVMDATDTVVATATGVAGLVSQVDVPLAAGGTYTWHARAVDDLGLASAYSATSTFTVAQHVRPSAPRINAPAFGAQVSSFTPDLTVDNATDLDPLRTLTYTFEVYADEALATPVASEAAVAEGATTTTWTETSTLAEDTFYYWRVRATDDLGVDGDWSTTGKFFVSTANTPPDAPILVSPLAATVVTDLRPPLVLHDADDADHDVLVYDWQLATDDAFADVIDSGDDVLSGSAATTTFTLAADLAEDTRYCWRARSDDGQAQSGYATACFLVSQTNDPPTVPAPRTPSDGGSVDNASPVFAWERSTDPEGMGVTYDIEVLNADGDVVATATDVAGLVSEVDATLVDGVTYTWHARAVDDQGVASDYSEPSEFTIELGRTNPSVVVNGNGCSANGGGEGTFVLLVLGVGAMILRRRK